MDQLQTIQLNPVLPQAEIQNPVGTAAGAEHEGVSPRPAPEGVIASQSIYPIVACCACESIIAAGACYVCHYRCLTCTCPVTIPPPPGIFQAVSADLGQVVGSGSAKAGTGTRLKEPIIFRGTLKTFAPDSVCLYLSVVPEVIFLYASPISYPYLPNKEVQHGNPPLAAN